MNSDDINRDLKRKRKNMFEWTLPRKVKENKIIRNNARMKHFEK